MAGLEGPGRAHRRLEGRGVGALAVGVLCRGVGRAGRRGPRQRQLPFVARAAPGGGGARRRDLELHGLLLAVPAALVLAAREAPGGYVDPLVEEGLGAAGAVGGLEGTRGG